VQYNLKHFPHIVYGTKVSLLRDELKKRVKYFINNPPTKLSKITQELELYLGQENLALEKGKYVFTSDNRDSLLITIFNSSSETFASGDFKIGIITEKFGLCRNSLSMAGNKVVTTTLPDGRFLHMFPDFSALFPNAYTFFRAYLNTSARQDKDVDEKAILVRLFTKQGSRDFPITVQTKQSL
jgi:hypothetical protein